MAKYIFNEKAPLYNQPVKNEAGILVAKPVRGVMPFGPQCNLITDADLTENIVAYLAGKDEFKEMISEVKTKSNNEK